MLLQMYLYAIKNGSGLARGAIIFSVSSAVIATIIGLYFYHEKITGYQTAGIVLGLISLVLIFWET
jgi:drug/metabolite transporter (DMT)-like permease